MVKNISTEKTRRSLTSQLKEYHSDENIFEIFFFLNEEIIIIQKEINFRSY